MSKYTTEIRYICENYAGLNTSEDYMSVKDVLKKAAPKVFNFDFPIFDEAYRLPLEIKILRHYYTREISEETVGLWKLRLEDRMNTIMPYYNKLYESELLKFNPLYDVDYNREGTANRTGTDKTSDNIIRVEDTTGTETGNIFQTENGTSTRTIDGNTKNTGTVENNGTQNDNENKTIDETGKTTDTGTSKLTTNGTETTSETSNGTTNTTFTTNRDTNSDAWQYFNDTPQGGVAQMNVQLTGLSYLTNATHNTENSNVTGTDTTRTTDENTTKGTRGTDNTSDGTTNNTQDVTRKTTESGSADRTTSGTETRNLQETNNVSENGTDSRDSHSSNTVNRSGKVNGSENREENKNSTDLNEYSEHVFGKQGGISFAKLLQEFRDTFLNIDAMVIDELSDLVFGLW